MTVRRSLPTALRFVIWLVLAPPIVLGIGALGYFLPAGAVRFDLIMALRIGCSIFLGWLFGLLRFRDGLQTGMSVLVILLSFAMPFIVLVFAIVATLLCGIDSCTR